MKFDWRGIAGRWAEMPRKRRILLAGGAAVLFVALAIWAWMGGKSQIRYRTAKIEKGAITASVTSSGTVNPVISVQVGSQVSGQIKEIYIDFNSEVKEGQLIARIDPETFEYKVRQMQADVDSAKAQEMMQRAELARQRVNLGNAKIDMERRLKLVDRGFLSPAERDTVKTTYEAQLELVRVGEANVKNAAASVKQKEALLAQAKVDLERTAIRSPVNGTVIQKTVEAGQTVAASLQAPELFVIAEDLTDMQVETSIDESEIGRVRVGQKATFTVDSYPGRTFEGEVKQIRLAAQNVSNVITYIVIVSAPNPRKELLPGMTANVRIILDTRHDVKLVPNAAMRFRLPSTETAVKGNARAGAKGNWVAAFLERMTKDLALSDEQKTRVEAVLTTTRSKMAVAHQAQETERKKQLEAARIEMREQIAAILDDGQRARFEEISAEYDERRNTSTTGRIYVLEEAGPVEMNVRLGLSDGSMTELMSPSPREGAEVILGVAAEGNGSAGGAVPRGPRMF
ncbi:MAG: efflux RND transporter periplasmic adaptor subunit [Oxalobacter formigenes]|nr:efflux RND transporter periplasmic adaptor subunit [Oxalobacter formigenes]